MPGRMSSYVNSAADFGVFETFRLSGRGSYLKSAADFGVFGAFLSFRPGVLLSEVCRRFCAAFGLFGAFLAFRPGVPLSEVGRRLRTFLDFFDFPAGGPSI